MSDEGQTDTEEQELESLQKQFDKEQSVEAVEDPKPDPKPEPEPVEEPKISAVEESAPEPIAEPAAAPEGEAKVDPMEWAKKKGLESPEAMARSLLEMEKEFHERNQKGHPGYQDLNGNPAPQPPVPPNWQPTQQPNRRPSEDVTKDLARRFQMDPEDVERLMPMIVETASAISRREMSQIEKRFERISRETERQGEVNHLMQDPLFHNPAIQAEIKEVLKNGNLFQTERNPYLTAFNIAVTNVARKQLQGSPVKQTSKPPVTASGGNGSSNATSRPVNGQEFEKLNESDQMKYLERLVKRTS